VHLFIDERSTTISKNKYFHQLNSEVLLGRPFTTYRSRLLRSFVQCLDAMHTRAVHTLDGPGFSLSGLYLIYASHNKPKFGMAKA